MRNGLDPGLDCLSRGVVAVGQAFVLIVEQADLVPVRIVLALATYVEADIFERA